MMWTNWQFWLDATWRAFRTFCQTLAAMLGGQAVNALTAPWISMLSVSGTAALVSLLMSVDRERAVGSVIDTPADPAAVEPTPPPALPLAAYGPGCGGDQR